MRETFVATQLYVWTQELARAGRSLDEELDRVLEEVGAAGYAAFEGFLGFFETPARAAAFRQCLARHGLRMPTAYTGGLLHEPDGAPATVARIVERAERGRECGLAAVVLNPDVVPGRKPDAALREQARRLNELGAALGELDLELWIHNHDPEMRDNARELRSNLDETDPELVGFCADLHWIWRGGGDPYATLERYGARVRSLHLRNSRSGVWSEELGDGDLDHARIARLADAIRFRGPLVVELAREAGTPSTRPLVESQRLSREYVRARFGV